ncbi:MAG: curlin repeat-containing protein [Pseudomonadota bacterium]
MTLFKTAFLAATAALSLATVATAEPFGHQQGQWNQSYGGADNRNVGLVDLSGHIRVERLHNPVTGQNYTAVIQTGTNNRFGAFQSGNRNTVRVVQRGNNTRVVVRQKGNNNNSSVVILGH